MLKCWWNCLSAGGTGVSLAADARSASQKQNLADILAVMGYPEALLVRHLQAATLTFRDVVERITGGRNPFTNVGVQYKGSRDDAALNSGVARFTADPGAVAALNADGRPTGVLPIPVVTIHSINDPQVVIEVESAYRETVTAVGSSDRLVQACTDERGHILQSPPGVMAALDSLMQWIEKGAKPSVQSIAAMCDQVKTTLDGPCRYHPEYSPSFTPPAITRARRRCANFWNSPSAARVGRRDRSTPIWGTPDVLPTWSRRQPMTRNYRDAKRAMPISEVWL